MPSLEINIETELSGDVGVFSIDYPDAMSSFYSSGYVADVGYEYNAFSTYGGPAGYTTFGSFLRFKVPISGVTINSAYLRLVKYAQFVSGPVQNATLRIVANDVDNASVPANNAAALTQFLTTRTTAETYMEVPYQPANEELLINVTDIVKEIIARPGWATNNYLILLYHSYLPSPLTTLTFLYKIESRAFSSLDQDKPKLLINYEPPLHPSNADKTVDHTLTVLSTPTLNTKFSLIEHIVLFSQECLSNFGWTRFVENRISLTSLPVYHPIASKYVESFVYVDDEWDKAYAHSRTIEDTLLINQDYRGESPLSRHVKDTLVIEQDIESTGSRYVTVEDILIIDHIATSNPNIRFVEHTISFFPEVISSPELQNPEDESDTVEIVQEITYNTVRTRVVEHILGIEHACLPIRDYTLTGLTSGAGGVNPGGGQGLGASPTAGGAKGYFPQADKSVNFPPEPTFLAPNEPGGGTMTLEYPTVSPTLSIELPAPLFGNREELQLTRIQRETRGGTLKTFSSDVWPKIRIFRYKFDSLTTAKIEEFFSFLSQTLGLQVRLTDHEGRQWDGFIVNNQGESAQFFRLCGKTTEFDFDGVEVEA